ncbi:EAL domain-containing protein [Sphaerotilus mobilis]|uniref:Diguanylate cyclase/phosphodiesterase with PAS/PAC sensor(S) n=1 Tax=Sphaerotilus mobilis TaxID=47994 RepID=A0A4Q7M9H1_9BURK|nr:EAL domain-containing protein [Sphaerotilus mobilis]RZS63292.1 diguanylate cyclase/phosphodiesterase with PAS/PAC sensor(s) [Sphaerotilus mobilis]
MPAPSTPTPSEARLASDLLAVVLRVFEYGPCAVWICDADETVVHATAASARLLGLAPDAALGRRPEDVLEGPSGNLTRWGLLRQRADQDGQASVDMLLGTGDDQALWCRLTLERLPVDSDQPGAPRLSALVLQDITDTRIQQALQAPVLDAIVHERPLHELMTLVCRQVETLAPDVVATVLRIDEDQCIDPLAGPSFPPEVAASYKGVPIGPSVGSCGTAAWRGSPVLVTDIASDPLWVQYRHTVLPLGFKACWSSPIKNHAQRVLATFAFYFRQARGPSDLHRRLVSTCLDLCTLAFEREHTRAHIHALAYYDGLTGLPNRRELQRLADEAVQSALREQQPLALLFIDLDDFKLINDSQGHGVGDSVLRLVAQRLERSVRQDDLVGRLAGDEFVVVLPGCDAYAARDMAERIAARLIDPLSVPNPPGAALTLHAGASIGLAMLPEDGEDVETLLRHADLAMYQAKALGRGQLAFFHRTLDERNRERMRLEIDLRRAIGAGELTLVYQPIVRANPQGILGLHSVEALTRWHHPQLGPIEPSRFIALAESSGLIGALSRWAVDSACAQMAAWRRADVAVPQVAVNLSARDFQDPGLVDWVSATLSRHGLPGESLTLELTESALLDRRNDNPPELEALRALGVRLALDDFGTGYSSLSHLHRLPIQRIKLDKSFVHDLEGDGNAQVLTTTVLRIGESLALEVVAEGVETEFQSRFLIERGCTLLQGYLHGRPMQAQALAGWIRDVLG